MTSTERGGGAWIGLLALAHGVTAAAAPLAQSERENALKAEFVERFTQFVEWPAEALGGPDAPFALCLLGTHPVRPFLEALARDRRIKNRPAVFRAIDNRAAFAGCHLVFIAQGQSLGSVQPAMLTISDSAAVPEAHIHLYRTGNKLRFAIAADAAKQCGLQISSRLMKLAEAP